MRQICREKTESRENRKTKIDNSKPCFKLLNILKWLQGGQFSHIACPFFGILNENIYSGWLPSSDQNMYHRHYILTPALFVWS